MATSGSSGTGEVTEVMATSATTVNTPLDLADTIGKGWLVVIAVNGSAGGVPVPAAPQLDGISLPLRVSRTTYCADDGAMSAIWAMPLTSDKAGDPFVLTFSQPYYGYTQPRQVAYKVNGVDVAGSVYSTNILANCAASTLTLNTPPSGCSFIAAISAKGGAAGTYTISNCDQVYGPMGADNSTSPGGSINYTINATKHQMIGMSLEFS